MLFEAARVRGDKVSSETWYKQSGTGTGKGTGNENFGRIGEARKYYERIILNNIG